MMKLELILQPHPLELAASIGQRCNNTTAGIGYRKNKGWNCLTIILSGQRICDSTVKLEDVDGLND
jgi:hypothetical protein